MAQDIIGSLFGIQQQPNYYAEDQRAAVDLANIQSPKAMGRYYGAMIGAPLGRALGQGVGSLLGVQDPRLQQASVIREAQQQGFDVTTPEGLQSLAQFFVQRGQPGLASQVAQQAQTMSRSAAEEQYKLAQAQAALREKKGSPQSQAEQVLLNQLQAQYGEVEGAQRFYQMQEQSKRSVAAAGVPQAGNVKVGDIATIMGTVKSNLDPYKKSLNSINQVKVYASQAKEGKSGAQAALDQGLLQIIGDNQVSKAEMQNLAASGSLPSRVANTVSKWATGTATLKSIQEKEDLLNALEYYVGNNYNQERAQQQQLWNTARLPQESIGAAIGKPFVSSWEKTGKTTGKQTTPNAPKVGTIQSGYRFKGGNPADPKNWEKI